MTRAATFALVLATALAGACSATPNDDALELENGAGKPDGASYAALSFEVGDDDQSQAARIRCNEPKYCDVTMSFEADGASTRRYAKAYFGANPGADVMRLGAYGVNVMGPDLEPIHDITMFVVSIEAHRSTTEPDGVALKPTIVSGFGHVFDNATVELPGLPKDQVVVIDVQPLLPAIAGGPSESTLYLAAAWQ